MNISNPPIRNRIVQPSYRTTDALGMDFSECVTMFSRSRKLGTAGANGPARPRTIYEYEYDLNRFFAEMRQRGRKHYNELTRDDVIAYIEAVQNRDLRDSSKFKVFRTLRAFFRWVERDPECQAGNMRGWLDCIPKIPKNRPRLYVPTPDTMMRFLNSFDRTTRWGLRDYTVTMLLIDCGLRIGELCHLRLSDILFDTAELLVPEQGKSGARKVPISATSTVPALRRWIRERDKFAHSEYLFLNKYGRQTQPGTYIQAFEEVRSRTGLGSSPEGNLTPHTCRHYFATEFLVSGGSLPVLKTILGHASFDTVQIYTHLASQRQFVREEHARYTPIDALMKGSSADGSGKKRRTGKTYLLRHGG